MHEEHGFNWLNFFGLEAFPNHVVMALIVSFVFVVFSQEAYYVVALLVSIPITHLVLTVIVKRLERATILSLVKNEQLYASPLAMRYVDDRLF